MLESLSEWFQGGDQANQAYPILFQPILSYRLKPAPLHDYASRTTLALSHFLFSCPLVSFTA